MTTFQIPGQKLSKNFVGILVETMPSKGHFEINWPLSKCQNHKEDSTNFCGLLREAGLWFWGFIKQLEIIGFYFEITTLNNELKSMYRFGSWLNRIKGSLQYSDQDLDNINAWFQTADSNFLWKALW